jgi:hypothetical protein
VGAYVGGPVGLIVRGVVGYWLGKTARQLVDVTRSSR